MTTENDPIHTSGYHLPTGPLYINNTGAILGTAQKTISKAYQFYNYTLLKMASMVANSNFKNQAKVCHYSNTYLAVQTTLRIRTELTIREPQCL